MGDHADDLIEKEERNALEIDLHHLGRCSGAWGGCPICQCEEIREEDNNATKTMSVLW